MSYIKELQEAAERLQDDIDGKNLELTLLESEMADVVSGPRIISEINGFFLQMLTEQQAFVSKKGLTPAVKTGRERVLRLMELLKSLSDISTSNYTLRCSNRIIHAQYQLMRIENKKLKEQLQAIMNAENF